jgi:hypothetical protein
MSRKRPSLLDRMIEHIDQRIAWLQQERLEVLELQAKEQRRQAPAPPLTRARRPPAEIEIAKG